MKNLLKNINITDFIPRFLASWLTTILFTFKSINVYSFIIIFFISFITYTYLNKKFKKLNIDSISLFINYLLCSFKWLRDFQNMENNLEFLLSILVFLIIITIYTINKNKKIINKLYISNKNMKILMIIVFSIPTLILITIGVLRYINFNAPNFDFGIFSHMFYNMKESFIPYSTCERDMLLSHFAVHFSPILYLILPIYYLFSTPITLQVIEVLLIFSGIIPLIKLCKHYKLSNKLILFISVLYCFYPVISTGTFYDFHENCFLTPILLWTFYFFEKGKTIPLYIFSMLCLMVKEDVFIYLVIFSIYIIISRKQYKTGLKILLLSLVYFIITSYFMNKYGLGIMSDRYENLIFDNTGLIGAIKTIIFNPGYTLSQLLNNGDKIIYLFKLFIPLLFIPFITKKTSRYILLIPVLINILTNYVYMFDITFHYSYGISAFLFYLTVLNIKDLKNNSLIYIIPLSLLITFITYYTFVIPNFTNNIITFKNNKDDYKIINDALKSIPTNASVSSSTFYLPHLTNRKVLYETYYHNNKLDIDYIVLDMRYNDELDRLEYYKENGYKVIIDKEGLITILKR